MSDRALNDAKQCIKKLQQRITTLEARYEKPCEDCGGSGYHEKEIPRLDDNGEYIGGEAIREKCPTCNGTGRVPRVVLPDMIARTLYMATQLILDTKMPSDFENTISFRYSKKYNIDRIPNSTDWEITEVKK